MAKIIATQRADDDLIKMLRELVQQAGVGTATKYLHALERVYLRLTDHPESGAPRPRLGRNVRIAPLTPYIVFYRYDSRKNHVYILRIPYGGRQIKRLL